MHNQKPYSQNETTHTSQTKKGVLLLNESGLCELVNMLITKSIDWKTEKKINKNAEKYRKIMVNMIALFLVAVEKIV